MAHRTQAKRSGAMSDDSGIRQITISEQIADHVLALISEQNLQPGDQLPSETELARTFNVSRPAVREATNALARQGIIMKAAGKRPVVRALSQRSFANLVIHGLVTRQMSVIEVLEARSGLEMIAAELAADYITEEETALLREVAEQLKKHVGDDEFSIHDQRLHRIIVDASRNSLIRNLLDGISSAVAQSCEAGLKLVYEADEWGQVLQLHLGIADAIIQKDKDAARIAMNAHFVSAIARTRKHLSWHRNSERIAIGGLGAGKRAV
jgi:DNA-binding FadR family transcriptional regulator